MRCRSGDRCARAALPEERFCAFHIGALLWVRFELLREREERAPEAEKRRRARSRAAPSPGRREAQAVLIAFDPPSLTAMSEIAYVGAGGPAGGVYRSGGGLWPLYELPCSPRVVGDVQTRERFAHAILTDVLGETPDAVVRGRFAAEVLTDLRGSRFFAVAGVEIVHWFERRLHSV